MSTTKLGALLATILALSAPTLANAFDRETTQALQLCHDYLWDVPAYVDLPNAAITVFPGLFDETTVTVFWNVYWDAPTVRAAGSCTIINGALEGFEDYGAIDETAE